MVDIVCILYDLQGIRKTGPSCINDMGYNFINYQKSNIISGVWNSIAVSVNVFWAIVANPIIEKVGPKNIVMIGTMVNCTAFVLYGTIR